jgi:hypothetical protein
VQTQHSCFSIKTFLTRHSYLVNGITFFVHTRKYRFWVHACLSINLFCVLDRIHIRPDTQSGFLDVALGLKKHNSCVSFMTSVIFNFGLLCVFSKKRFATHTICFFGKYVFWRPKKKSIILLFGHGQNVFWPCTFLEFFDKKRVLGLTRFGTNIHFVFLVTTV